MTTAIKYRMGAGFAGDVNRTHPVSIEPCFPDATNPPTAPGQAVIIDASSHQVRPLLASGDNALDAIYGITVRAYPLQQATDTVGYGQVALGAGSLPASRTVDVMRSGYMMVALGDGQLTGAVKGGRVYVWAAAATGHHTVGGFETAACANKTILLDEKAFYNGVEDASGIVEIAYNI